MGMGVHLKGEFLESFQVVRSHSRGVDHPDLHGGYNPGQRHKADDDKSRPTRQASHTGCNRISKDLPRHTMLLVWKCLMAWRRESRRLKVGGNPKVLAAPPYDWQ